MLVVGRFPSLVYALLAVFVLSSIQVGCKSDSHLEISPAQIEFGSIEIGAPARRLSVKVANTGEDAVELVRFGLEEPSNVFRVEPPPTTAIEGFDTMRIGLLYQPVGETEDAATFMVEADGDTGEHVVALSGRGARLGGTVGYAGDECGVPGSMSFGSTFVGQQVRRTITVESTGTGPIAFFAQVEPPSSEWTFSKSFRSALEPGVKGEITVIYNPEDAGVDQPEIVITTNSHLVEETRIPGCGEGHLAAVCVRPTSLSLGRIAANTSTSATIELTSCGDLPLDLTQISISVESDHPSDPGFAITSTTALPQTLAPTEKLDVLVEFTAPTGDPKSGYVHVRSNATVFPDTYIPMSANTPPPCTLSISPAQLNFFVGGSPDRRLTIGNDGTESCQINRVDLTAGGGTFTIMNPGQFPAALAPGQALTRVISYAAGPTASWPESGEIEIELTRGWTEIARVPLVGNPTVASGCHLDPSPSALSFGMLEAGDTGAEQSIVTNVGDADCTISSSFIAPSSHEDLLYGGPAGTIRIAPGDEVPLEVLYLPLFEGLASGRLVLDSPNASRTRIEIPLYGEARERPARCENCECDHGQVKTYRRFDEPLSPSGVLDPSQESPFHVKCEPFSCNANEVYVERDIGDFVCAPLPPSCRAGEGLEFDRRWDCIQCDVIVQYGRFFNGKRVCAPNNQLMCAGNWVPAFLEDKSKWECVNRCNNIMFDRRYLPDGQMVCLPSCG